MQMQIIHIFNLSLYISYNIYKVEVVINNRKLNFCRGGSSHALTQNSPKIPLDLRQQNEY